MAPSDCFNLIEIPWLFGIHDGVILSMAREPEVSIDRGRGRTIPASLSEGEVEEIASFGSKWVDCVASDGEHFACSSGRVAYVWSPDSPNQYR